MGYLCIVLLSILTMSSISYGMKSSIPVSGLLPGDPLFAHNAAISPDWNYLEIKGSFIGGLEAEILVYHYVDSSKLWVNVYSIDKIKDYSIRLSPEEDYQVWFLSPEGDTKILCIESGMHGTYSLKCDIDFFVPSKLFSKLYQDDKSCEYIMDTSRGYFITYDIYSIDNVEAKSVSHEQ